MRLTASRFEHEENYFSPGIAPFFEVPPNGSETDFQRDQLQWLHSFELSDKYRLDFGADYRAEEGDNIGFLEFFGNPLPTDFELDRDALGFFGNLSATPLAGVQLSGGVRRDDPEGFADETSWLAGIAWEVLPRWRFNANWGQAYKLPSFFALGHALVGNPDLVPEKGESWDVGFTWLAE